MQVPFKAWISLKKKEFLTVYRYGASDEPAAKKPKSAKSFHILQNTR